MRFSLNWLREFVDVDHSPTDLAARLTTGGFEVGSVEPIADPSGKILDHAFEVDITANRPDVMNHFGLAREIAALFDRPLTLPFFSLVESGTSATEAARIEIDAKDLCPAYVGRVVIEARVGESPRWLKERLTAIGLAPKNNIVDASNYVLFELGQPLHAFDLDRLAGRGVLVRRSRAGESIVTVADRERRALPQGLLVIAELGERGTGPPAAVAGVMGGLDTAISDATRSVLIESAWFDARSVRRAARALALHTDASHRFERGADPGMTRFAADRLAAMIAELTGGRILEGVVSAGDSAIAAWNTRTPSSSQRGGEEGMIHRFTPRHRPEPLLLRTKRLRRFLGLEARDDEIESALSRLGIETTRAAASSSTLVPTRRAAAGQSGDLLSEAGVGATLSCRIPTWRSDVTREEDLIEEFARLTGYDAIPETLPNLDAPSPISARSGEDRARSRMASFGYREAICYAMISKPDDGLFGALPLLDEATESALETSGEPRRTGERSSGIERASADPDPRSGSKSMVDGGAGPAPLVITNPLSDRWEIMRRSLLPGLSRALVYNIAHGRVDLRLFEIGSVHARSDAGLAREVAAACVGGCGLGQEAAWPAPSRPYDVLDLEGAIASLAGDLLGDRLGADRLRFLPPPVDAAPPARRSDVFHPGQSFVVRLDGRTIGRGGRLHADVERAIESDRPLYVAEIALAPLLEERSPVRFRVLPRLNPVDRDLSFLVGRDVPFSAIENAVRSAVSSLSPTSEPKTSRPEGDESRSEDHTAPTFVLIDRFEGGSLPAGRVSYAFRFRFSPRERALTTEELNASIEAIAAHLTTDLGAEIRSKA